MRIIVATVATVATVAKLLQQCCNNATAFAMAPWHFCHGTCVATVATIVATTKIEK